MEGSKVDSASDRAYADLRSQILNGQLKPDEMITEALVATDLGLSRTPVRAALGRLQDEGWVTVYPKRGALINGLSERTVRELTEARALLESAAVMHIKPETWPALAAVFTRNVAAQRQAASKGNMRVFIELSMQFHRSFVEAAGNRVILELHDRMADRQRFLLFSYGDALAARCHEIVAEHEQMVEDAESRDLEGFGTVLRRHLSETYQLPSFAL